MTAAFTRAGSAAASPPYAAASETSSDKTLIGRIADGDQLAMRTLFARHRVALYRWLLRIVRDETLAEDLLSDVFLDVWRQAASFQGRASVSTWLLAIARYKALSARRPRIDAELDARIASTIADPADDPEAPFRHVFPAVMARCFLRQRQPCALTLGVIEGNLSQLHPCARYTQATGRLECFILRALLGSFRVVQYRTVVASSRPIW